MWLGEANIVWLRQASGMQPSQLTATEAGKEHAAGAGKWLQAEIDKPVAYGRGRQHVAGAGKWPPAEVGKWHLAGEACSRGRHVACG